MLRIKRNNQVNYVGKLCRLSYSRREVWQTLRCKRFSCCIYFPLTFISWNVLMFEWLVPQGRGKSQLFSVGFISSIIKVSSIHGFLKQAKIEREPKAPKDISLYGFMIRTWKYSRIYVEIKTQLHFTSDCKYHVYCYIQVNCESLNNPFHKFDRPKTLGWCNQ